MPPAVQPAVTANVAPDGLHSIVARRGRGIEIDARGGVGGADEGGTIDSLAATALAQLCPGGVQHALEGVDRGWVGKREGSRKRRSGGGRERRLGDRDGDRIRDLRLALSG